LRDTVIDDNVNKPIIVAVHDIETVIAELEGTAPPPPLPGMQPPAPAPAPAPATQPPGAGSGSAKIEPATAPTVTDKKPDIGKPADAKPADPNPKPADAKSADAKPADGKSLQERTQQAIAQLKTARQQLLQLVQGRVIANEMLNKIE